MAGAPSPHEGWRSAFVPALSRGRQPEPTGAPRHTSGFALSRRQHSSYSKLRSGRIVAFVTKTCLPWRNFMDLRLSIPLFGLLAACATSSPAAPETAENSSAAIRAAEEVGATHSPDAALHLQLAKEQF